MSRVKPFGGGSHTVLSLPEFALVVRCIYSIFSAKLQHNLVSRLQCVGRETESNYTLSELGPHVV